MTELTSDGLIRTRLDERLAALKSDAQGIFGADISLEPDDLDGQFIGAVAESFSNQDQLIQALYNGFNPRTATGVMLSNIVQLNGIRRDDGSFSTAVVTVAGTPGQSVRAGTQVQHTVTLSIFAVNSTTVVGGGGTVDVDVTALTKGPYLAPAGADWQFVHPLYGLTGVVSDEDATPGTLFEEDSDLQARQRTATATPSQALVDGLESALKNLNGVTQCRVYENYFDTVDGNGQQAHSIHAVLIGGTESAIVNMMWLKRTTGVTPLGDLGADTPVIDSQGNSQIMLYDRPVEVPIYITVNLTAIDGWPSDGDVRIKAAIAAWALANQKIGTDVVQSLLYVPINSVPGSSVQDVFVDTAPSPSASDDIPIDYVSLATFDGMNIVVNVS